MNCFLVAVVVVVHAESVENAMLENVDFQHQVVAKLAEKQMGELTLSNCMIAMSARYGDCANRRELLRKQSNVFGQVKDPNIRVPAMMNIQLQKRQLDFEEAILRRANAFIRPKYEALMGLPAKK